MHYRHSYHAGNFADVFKHVILCGLIAAMNRKDKPWCALDTHAGAGFYDLSGEGAMRTGEWRDGIARLDGIANLPEPLATFMRVVSAGNAPGKTLYYPGSPQFIAALARETDRMMFCEKVADVAEDLRRKLEQTAQEEKSRIIASANQEIEASKRAAISELRKTTADLSIKIAEKLIQANLDDAKQRALVDQLINEVSTAKG